MRTVCISPSLTEDVSGTSEYRTTRCNRVRSRMLTKVGRVSSAGRDGFSRTMFAVNATRVVFGSRFLGNKSVFGARLLPCAWGSVPGFGAAGVGSRSCCCRHEGMQTAIRLNHGGMSWPMNRRCTASSGSGIHAAAWLKRFGMGMPISRRWGGSLAWACRGRGFAGAVAWTVFEKRWINLIGITLYPVDQAASDTCECAGRRSISGARPIEVPLANQLRHWVTRCRSRCFAGARQNTTDTLPDVWSVLASS